jgi:cysteine desulfurase
VDPEVLDAMQPWFGRPGNPHSEEHSFGWQARTGVDEAKGKVASLIGAAPEDIVFTSGATEANNIAVLGIMRFPRNGRHRLIASAIEHASVLEPALALKVIGIQTELAPVNADGILNRESFLRILDEDVRLVSVGAVNGEIGTIQDLAWIADRCHEKGALLHADCAQALTASPSLIAKSGADLISLSAHKAYGPQGIGALYVSPGIAPLISQIAFGGGQQFGIRPGTLSTALCVGFGVACELLSRYGNEEINRVRKLRDSFFEMAEMKLPNVKINGPLTNRHPGNISLQLPDMDARDLIQRMQPEVALSTGSACHSGSQTPSHVLTAIGLSTEEAISTVRLGFGRFTTPKEIEFAISALAEASARAELPPARLDTTLLLV